MTFNFTGIIYGFGALMFLPLSLRFYNHWKERKTTISKDFFYVGLCFFAFSLLTAIGSLYFVDDIVLLKWVVVVTTLLQSLAMALLGHLVFYLKFPNYSPWIGFFIIISLGIVATVFTAMNSFEPVLTGNVVDWNFPAINSILRGIIFSLALLPTIFIFFQKALSLSDKTVKMKTIIFNLLFLVGFLSAICVFFLGERLHLNILVADIAMLFVYFIALLVMITTQQSKDTYVKEI